MKKRNPLKPSTERTPSPKPVIPGKLENISKKPSMIIFERMQSEAHSSCRSPDLQALKKRNPLKPSTEKTPSPKPVIPGKLENISKKPSMIIFERMQSEAHSSCRSPDLQALKKRNPLKPSTEKTPSPKPVIPGKLENISKKPSMIIFERMQSEARRDPGSRHRLHKSYSLYTPASPQLDHGSRL